MRLYFIIILLLGAIGLAPSVARASEAKAVFAGGCFWCMEASFDKLEGVKDVRAGFSGGQDTNPTYEKVARGGTGHAEAVEVTYDPAIVPYDKLIGIYWDNVDPTDEGGQFCDRGSVYRPIIFVGNAQERLIAEKTKADLTLKLGEPVIVPIQDSETFYPAGEQYEDFHERNPLRYALYRQGCGQDRRLEEIQEKIPQ